eukprot:3334144-Pyramimonas_sp.AAC.1
MPSGIALSPAHTTVMGFGSQTPSGCSKTRFAYVCRRTTCTIQSWLGISPRDPKGSRHLQPAAA